MKKSDLRFNPVYFLSYVAMFMIVELVQYRQVDWLVMAKAMFSNFLLYSAIAWGICFVAALSGRKWRRTVHGLAHAVVMVYTVSTLIMVMLFDRHWDAMTIQFVAETNSGEASEFFQTYLADWRVWLLLAAAPVWLLAERWSSKRVPSLPLIPRKVIYKVALGLWLLFEASNVIYFRTNVDLNYELVNKLHSHIRNNALWNIWQSCLKYKEFEAEYARCIDVQRSYDEPVRCKENAADVVLIIGESFNRHMSNLYDGKYDTNPLLKERLRRSAAGDADGRMFVFSDVAATINSTTENFKYFLSATSVGDKGKSWCDSPLFPTILRRCGYNSIFYSNQFVTNECLGRYDIPLGFLNHPAIASCLFDHRNSDKYAYDLELVADYAAHRSQLERKNRNLCIFHLYGQHVKFSQRFPDTFCRFRAEDVSRHYQMRNPSNAGQILDKGQRQDVADYLNATAYNDIVVDSIIKLFERRNAVVIYFADHGEEVHNIRRQYGRTGISTADHQSKQCQLDVPFIVYMSPQYVKLHPQQVQRMAAATRRKFSTDNLPNLIFDLLGVESRYFISKNSVINDAYQEPRQILLQNGQMY